MQDYQYTIHREGRQMIQRQVIEHVGVIILCENRAAKVLDIAAMTYYGNYCYHWDATSEGVTLLKASDDYVMDKLLCGHDERRVLDMDATCKELRRVIGRDDCHGFDNAWCAMTEQLDACRTLNDLLDWANDQGKSWDVTEETVKSATVYRYGDGAQDFLKYALPAIRRSAQELERARGL